ncbi:MAG: hypothetical protein IPK82_36505 [Polyangiaceae bacterium]|nr:hypothetical protein [Polyangiaceae bacterium]
MSPLRTHLGAFVGAALIACTPAAPPPTPVTPVATASPTEPSVHIAFEIPRGDGPVDMAKTPWPTEMARTTKGGIDLRAHPGRGSPLIDEYLAVAAESLDGFSIAPVVYFRFPSAKALPTLPPLDPAHPESAPIVLVDVDEKSPEKGTFYPLTARAVPRDMRYLKAGTLAVRPLDGFTLRGSTLYAAVVKRSLGTAAARLAPPPDLEAVLSTAPRTNAAEEKARAIHAPALVALETAGIARADIASIAVFRTGNPTLRTQQVVAAVDALFASKSPSGPRIVSAAWTPPHGSNYRVIRGTYCTPNFQAKIENAPFIENPGGGLLRGPDGLPSVVPLPPTSKVYTKECGDFIRARFTLSVPNAPAPPDGYPLLVTAHGTGGNADTFLGPNDFAGWAAEEGFAAIATDQPLNGGAASGRPGAAGPLVLPSGIPIAVAETGVPAAFYNPLYPGAAVGNLHQAAADLAVLVRLFGGADLSAVLTTKKPVFTPGPGTPAPKFNQRQTALAGHSQGCQSAGVLAPLDPHVRSVILSGCGGDVRLGLLYGRPVETPLAPWVTLLLGLDPDELSEFHPLLALVQNLADPIDPLAYARLFWQSPAPQTPPFLLHVEGLRDRYTPEASAEAYAIALRAETVGPVPKPIPLLPLARSRSPQTPANRWLAQFAPDPGQEGHFVLYRKPDASILFRHMLRRVVETPGKQP